jgi:hypothetical protein
MKTSSPGFIRTHACDGHQPCTRPVGAPRCLLLPAGVVQMMGGHPLGRSSAVAWNPRPSSGSSSSISAVSGSGSNRITSRSTNSSACNRAMFNLPTLPPTLARAARPLWRLDRRASFVLTSQPARLGV